MLKLNHVRVDLDNAQLENNEDSASWRKQLVNEFYTLVSICQYDNEDSNLDNHAQMLNANMTNCKETIWSSLSPDPKSTITKFDAELLKLL